MSYSGQSKVDKGGRSQTDFRLTQALRERFPSRNSVKISQIWRIWSSLVCKFLFPSDMRTFALITGRARSRYQSAVGLISHDSMLTWNGLLMRFSSSKAEHFSFFVLFRNHWMRSSNWSKSTTISNVCFQNKKNVSRLWNVSRRTSYDKQDRNNLKPPSVNAKRKID